MSAAGALACRDLHKRFAQGASALAGVSLDIPAGSFFTLVGPSGCGKTTLLRAIAGLERPDSGTIELDGVPLDTQPPHRRPVNTVFQHYAVFPHMTVSENVAFALRMRRRPAAEIAARVAAMLALVRLDGLGARRPAQLSGGQQQRVALARALAAGPKVLLLDEPLSALDTMLRSQMRLELKRLQRETGITFVLVTHDQHEAIAISDMVGVMRAGAVEQIGPPVEIYERPASRFVAEFVGEANLLSAVRIGPRRYCLVGGAELHTAEDGPPQRSATLMIRPEQVALTTPGRTNLDGVVVQAVYDGAHTTLHLTVAGHDVLRARVPNRPDAPIAFAPGMRVGITIAAAAVRVLPA